MDAIVKVTDTVTVCPQPPVSASIPLLDDDHILPLSHLDNDPNLRTTIRYIRVYANFDHNQPPSAADPFRIIADSLSKALYYYYPLTGVLRNVPNTNRLELFCAAGRGVPLLRAAVDCFIDSVSYLDDHPGSELSDHLAPDPGLEQGLASPFMLQVTVFKCGGFCLGAAIHHVLCDGLGATQVFNVMAELARGSDRVVAVELPPVWDRVRLLGPRAPPRVVVPLEEVLSLDEEKFEPYGFGAGPVERVFVDVKEEWLDRFKRELMEECGCSFTSFEALGAFIWRAKVKVSGVPSNERVKFAYSINIRKLLNPPLPAGYWGNGCVPIYVQLSAKDLLEQPIWRTADLIKKSKSQATDEYVRSFIDFQELNYDRGINSGKWVSGFTDWRHLGHSTVNFGWGGPVTVLPLSRNLLGSAEPCFFLPYSSVRQGRKDGFKVLVTLQHIAVSAFKEEMRKLTVASCCL